MNIRVDSVEYKCWHEVGHAVVCLHLGGDVDFIEFLDGDERGHARTRCVVLPAFERSVACGGFAAEFHLLNLGLAGLGEDDKRDVSQVVFHNATFDREEFWGRQLGSDEVFSEAEDRSFMDFAIESVVPIIAHHFEAMHSIVRELFDARRIDGMRVKELLRLQNAQ